MSRRDYLPEAETPFARWCDTFVNTIAADPARYGLAPEDAAALESARATFSDARATAADPGTRTPVAVLEKNLARAALERLVRAAAHRVQSFPGTDADDRVALGLAQRNPHASRIGPPATRPVLVLTTLPRGTIPALRIFDEEAPHRVAFPPGVVAALIFTCAIPPGANPPASLDDWRFEGVATKTLFPLPERPADAGRRVYAQALWINPRGEAGPRSAPILLSPGLAVAA